MLTVLQGNLLLLGGGNMGAALLRGVLDAEILPAGRIVVVDVDREKLRRLETDHGVAVDTAISGHVSGAGAVLLAVKPAVVGEVLDAMRGELRADQLVLSIVAGVSTSTIADRIGQRSPVIRAMPNIAAVVGASASALAGSPAAGEEHFAMAESILGSVGRVVRVDECLIDAVTGLSGSGPAYIYLVIEALSDGGVRMGLPREVARTLAVQTVLGAARMVGESGEHPAVLRDRVTTPGGTTIAGLQALEDGSLRATLMRAVEAATRRSRDLNAL